MDKLSKQEKFNNTINYNLFGDPKEDILEENLEVSALMFKKLKDDDLEIDDEVNVRKILEYNNPFDNNYLEFYKL